jgi:hypothetical protein
VDRRMVLQLAEDMEATMSTVVVQEVMELLGPEYEPPNKNRHYVEVPDNFAVARWSRDADSATIARCILATLKYEPHSADTTPLRLALEAVIERARKEVRREH